MKATSSPLVHFRYFPVSQRDKKWGLFATTAGETRTAPHTVYPPSGHPKGFAFDWQQGRSLEGYALVYISSGRGTFESRPDFSATIEPGHAFLLFPGVWHRYTPDPETGWCEHWVGFDGETARRWQKQKFISPEHPVQRINAEDTVLATFSRIMQSIHANRPALQQILAGATAYLLGLFYSAQQTPPAIEHPNPDIIEQAIACIQADFARGVNLTALAEELAVSYSWLRSRFTHHTGLSPHQYLLQLRIARARSLLTDTELSIKEIATRTGFRDEHYFSRLFRQKVGLTPSQWRSRNRCGR